MKCPYCQYHDTRVVDSRAVNDGVRRRRQCLSCDSRFTTYERFQSNTFLIVKKDERREEFCRDKLVSGVRKACTKRPVSDEDIERLVDAVEEDLHEMGKVEVPSSMVGALVMQQLRDLDRIAYIRFASVYRAFADVESFREEVDALVEGRGDVPAAQLPLISADDFVVSVRNRKVA